MKAEEFEKIMKDNGLTNVQMSEKLKISTSSAAQYRTGERKIPPYIELLIKFVFPMSERVCK